MENPYQSQLDQLSTEIESNRALLDDPELGPLAVQEIQKLEEQKKVIEQAASEYDLTQQNDGAAAAGEIPVNCIIEFRPGAGGDEAKIWATEIQRMYLRYAEKLGFKIEMIDDLVIKVRGKTNTLSLPELPDGSTLELPLTAYQVFSVESGVHRVQRVPETESAGRVHTSTASVAVLPEVSSQAVEIRDEDLEWQFMRASGAGGQSVNKTNSAVRLTHKPSGIVVGARQERKQTQNRQIALELLRAQLWEIQEEERLKEIGDARAAIGRNRRAEKIRTYNFPQNRVTDHRIKESWHNLESILEGGLDDLTVAYLVAMELEAHAASAED